jgi:hypothetical protein
VLLRYRHQGGISQSHIILGICLLGSINSATNSGSFYFHQNSRLTQSWHPHHRDSRLRLPDDFPQTFGNYIQVFFSYDITPDPDKVCPG